MVYVHYSHDWLMQIASMRGTLASKKPEALVACVDSLLHHWDTGCNVGVCDSRLDVKFIYATASMQTPDLQLPFHLTLRC